MVRCGTIARMIKPLHDEFMDDDMRGVWRTMSPLPNDLRLYGGTALALYLNHRASVDFDFATPELVDMGITEDKEIQRWAGGARFAGGDGMVDAIISGAYRDITVTFMECGHLVPMPRFKPIPAKNGVLVADPRDIIDAKFRALVSRGNLNDYQDAAAFIAAWPDWAEAMAHENRNYTAPQVAYALNNLGPFEDGELTDGEIIAIRKFGEQVLGPRPMDESNPGNGSEGQVQ